MRMNVKPPVPTRPSPHTNGMQSASVLRSVWPPVVFGVALVLLAYASIAMSIQAQSRTVDADMRQAAADIAEIEAAYTDIHAFVMSGRGTITDVMEAKQAIDAKRNAFSDISALVPTERLQAALALLQDSQHRESLQALQVQQLSSEIARLQNELGRAQGSLEAYKALRRRPRWWVWLFGGE